MAAEDTKAAEAPVAEDTGFKVASLDGHKKSTLLVSMAALILADAGKDVSAEDLTTLLTTSKNSVDAYWPTVFAKLLKGRSAMDFINLGGGGGGGGGGDAGAAGAAVEEEKKEEEEEEEEEEIAMGGLMGGDDDAGW